MLIDDIFQRCTSRRSDISEHLPTLRRYAEASESIVEMGVRTGQSTAAFLAGRPRRLTSYDIDGEYFLRKVAPLYQRAADEAEVQFQYVVADVLQLEIEPTDLLFIDTWHVYSQLQQELKLHAPKATKYIILHDTETFGELGEDPVPVRLRWKVNELARRYTPLRPREVPRHKGLRPAVDEFLAENPQWCQREHFRNNNGLTVLERVESQPA